MSLIAIYKQLMTIIKTLLYDCSMCATLASKVETMERSRGDLATLVKEP
jgi:hypothetical protein